MKNIIRKLFRSFMKDGPNITLQRIWRYLNQEIQKLNLSSTPNKYAPPIDIFEISEINIRKLTGGPKDNSIYIIIPDFAKGSGGHSTIFRFAQQLVWRGSKCTFLVHGIYNNFSSEDIVTSINQDFRYIPGVQAEVFNNFYQLQSRLTNLTGDIIIGTCWKSILYSLASERFNERIAFVQDREGLFTSYSQSSVIADHTLTIAKYCKVITAGPWLAQHYEKSTTFKLGADQEQIDTLRKLLNQKQLEPNLQKKIIKIAFYSRFSSARRAVDLGWSIFEKLSQIRRDYDFEIHAFGEDIENTVFPFKVINHGTLSQNELNLLLCKCDVGVAFSTTNYSILPIEMLCAGLLTFDLKTRANDINYHDFKNVNLLTPIPQLAVNEFHQKISEHIKTNSKNPKTVLDLSWDTNFKVAVATVTENIIVSKRLSVCIPTYNSSKTIVDLIETLLHQKHVDIELNILDSESTDNSLNKIYELWPNVTIQKIKQKDFKHGSARNLLAKMASCDYVLFLTQDVILPDPYLCRSMIDAIETQDVALVFSKHVAQPKHSAFTHRDINSHFKHILQFHRKKVDRFSKVPSDVKRFNSNNCALYRREILNKIPFRDVSYGEDQLWANDIIIQKFSKFYLNSTFIIHSHDESEATIMERAEIETRFFFDNVKIIFGSDWTNLEQMNQRDIEFAELKDLDESEIQTRLAFNRKVAEGRRAALKKCSTGELKLL